MTMNEDADVEVAAEAGSQDGKARGLSRRALIQAGVYAAPVIVLATAVPAAASSDDPVDGVDPQVEISVSTPSNAKWLRNASGGAFTVTLWLSNNSTLNAADVLVQVWFPVGPTYTTNSGIAVTGGTATDISIYSQGANGRNVTFQATVPIGGGTIEFEITAVNHDGETSTIRPNIVTATWVPAS